jgi:hypothetical protein
MTGPHGTFPLVEYDATCQHKIEPPVCRGVCPVSNRTAMSLPCQHAIVSATSACATCHPYSGDTCHPLTGPIPVVCHITYHVSSPGDSTSSVWMYSLYSQPAMWTVRTVQSPPFFTYLGFQTECDIFRIRSPFDKVNIWMESGR